MSVGDDPFDVYGSLAARIRASLEEKGTLGFDELIAFATNGTTKDHVASSIERLRREGVAEWADRKQRSIKLLAGSEPSSVRTCEHGIDPWDSCDPCDAARRLAELYDPFADEGPQEAPVMAPVRVAEPLKTEPGVTAPTKPKKTTQRKPITSRKPSRAGWGLERRREWSLAASRHFHNQPAIGRLAAILAMYADTEGCFFVGMDTLAESIGVHRDTIKVQRKALVAAGCIKDTGRKKARATVWQLIEP